MVFKNSCTIKLASKERIKQWATIEIPKKSESITPTKEVNESAYAYEQYTGVPRFIGGYTLQKNLTTLNLCSLHKDTAGFQDSFSPFSGFTGKEDLQCLRNEHKSTNTNLKYAYAQAQAQARWQRTNNMKNNGKLVRSRLNKSVALKGIFPKNSHSSMHLHANNQPHNHKLLAFPINDTVNSAKMHPLFNTSPDGECAFSLNYSEIPRNAYGSRSNGYTAGLEKGTHRLHESIADERSKQEEMKTHDESYILVHSKLLRLDASGIHPDKGYSINSLTGKMHKKVSIPKPKDYEGVYSKIIKPNKISAPKFLKTLPYNHFWICLPFSAVNRHALRTKYLLHKYTNKHLPIKQFRMRFSSRLRFTGTGVPIPRLNAEYVLQGNETHISNPYTPYQCSTTGLGMLKPYFAYKVNFNLFTSSSVVRLQKNGVQAIRKCTHYWLPEPKSSLVSIPLCASSGLLFTPTLSYSLENIQCRMKILRVHTPLSYDYALRTKTSFYALRHLYFNTLSLKKSVSAYSYTSMYMHDMNTKVLVPSADTYVQATQDKRSKQATYALRSNKANTFLHTPSLPYPAYYAKRSTLSGYTRVYDKAQGRHTNSWYQGLQTITLSCSLINNTPQLRYTKESQLQSKTQTVYDNENKASKVNYGYYAGLRNTNVGTFTTDAIIQRLPKVHWNRLSYEDCNKHFYNKVDSISAFTQATRECTLNKISVVSKYLQRLYSVRQRRQLQYSQKGGIGKSTLSCSLVSPILCLPTQIVNTRMNYRPLSLYMASKNYLLSVFSSASVDLSVSRRLNEVSVVSKYSQRLYISVVSKYLQRLYISVVSKYLQRLYSVANAKADEYQYGKKHNATSSLQNVLNNVVACYKCYPSSSKHSGNKEMRTRLCSLRSLAIGTNNCEYNKFACSINQWLHSYVAYVHATQKCRNEYDSRSMFGNEALNFLSRFSDIHNTLKNIYANETFEEGNYYMLLAYEAQYASHRRLFNVKGSAIPPYPVEYVKRRCNDIDTTRECTLKKVGMWNTSTSTPIYIRKRARATVGYCTDWYASMQLYSDEYEQHNKQLNSQPFQEHDSQIEKQSASTRVNTPKHGTYYGKFGEVSVADTLNYRTLKPVKNGLFCETLFGPTKDWQCQCGKLKFTRSPKSELWCPNCLVQITRSVVRRVRMGYIKLAAPVMHVWYKKQSNNPLVQVLSLNAKDITSILDAKMLCVASPKWVNCCTPSISIFEFETWEHEIYAFIKGEQSIFDRVAPWNNFALRSKECNMSTGASLSVPSMRSVLNTHEEVWPNVKHTMESTFHVAGSKFAYLNDTSTFAFSQIFERLSYKEGLLYIRYKIHLLDSLGYSHKSLLQKQIFSHISRSVKPHVSTLHGSIATDTGKPSEEVSDECNILANAYTNGPIMYTLPENTPFAILQKKKALLDCFTLFKRTLSRVHSSYTRVTAHTFDATFHVAETQKSGYAFSGTKLDSLFLSYVPVLPPDLRPIVQVQSGKFATSDVNDLYRFVIFRNNRLKRFIQENVPEAIFYQELRLVQHSVDALFDNGKLKQPISRSPMYEQFEPLKSLSDRLVGKRGRFRLNLLGKRVDYSGRSVIVVGPKLRLFQCGLPVKMAFELFFPFLIQNVLKKGLAKTTKSAKMFLREYPKMVRCILGEIIHSHPVILNRAPTLHRMGVQSFFPVLVEGKAIQLHPLICPSFNADFDGDQMAVHLPLRFESQVECRFLMLSPHNWISPADGESIINMSQDMVLGFYYLTFASTNTLPASSPSTPRAALQSKALPPEDVLRYALRSKQDTPELNQYLCTQTQTQTQTQKQDSLSRLQPELLHTHTIPSESSYECTRFGMKLHDKFWMDFNVYVQNEYSISGGYTRHRQTGSPSSLSSVHNIPYETLDCSSPYYVKRTFNNTFTVTRSTSDENCTSCIVSRTGWVYEIYATTVKFQDSFGKDRSLYILTTIGRFIFNNYLLAKMPY